MGNLLKGRNKSVVRRHTLAVLIRDAKVELRGFFADGAAKIVERRGSKSKLGKV